MKFSLIIFFVSINLIALAQEGEISGFVQDDKGYPMEFATVQIQNTSTGVVTDENGYFNI